MKSEGYFSVTCEILFVWDYSERLSAHFNLEIQSDHFTNGRSLFIEGCNIDFVDEDHNAQSEFHSHPSNDSRQDTSKTHEHMIYILNELETSNKLNINCTI